MAPNDFPGFWISPDGEVLRVQSTHIATVCADPERFGLTAPSLAAAFEQRGEAWASEGYAREDILRALVRSGWVRVRRYRSGWTFNVCHISDVVLLRVRELLRELYGSSETDEQVRLDHPAGVETTTVVSILSRKL